MPIHSAGGCRGSKVTAGQTLPNKRLRCTGLAASRLPKPSSFFKHTRPGRWKCSAGKFYHYLFFESQHQTVLYDLFIGFLNFCKKKKNSWCSLWHPADCTALNSTCELMMSQGAEWSAYSAGIKLWRLLLQDSCKRCEKVPALQLKKKKIQKQRTNQHPESGKRRSPSFTNT